MKRFCTLAVLGLVTAGSTAMAGPNAGGVLMVHTDDTVVYTPDQGSYNDLSGLECPQDYDCLTAPDDCGNTAPTPTSGKPGTETSVWWVLAAFPEGSCPRLSGLTFGATWPSENAIAITASGHSGDFELPTGLWPYYLGEGTAVTWSTAQQSRVMEVYWFAGTAYYGPATFTLGPHPTQDGNFADDAIPSNIDAIFDYGKLGLGGDVGTVPNFPPTPTEETSWGEIKSVFGNE